MVDLTPDHRRVVRAILDRVVPGVEARAFGSRVSGGARPHSDLDLALVSADPIPWETIETLREAFADSDLPFRVDVSDWSRLDDALRRRIETSFEVI